MLDEARDSAEQWARDDIDRNADEEPAVEVEAEKEKEKTDAITSPAEQEIARKVKRCVALVREGYLSRGTATLLQNPLASSSSETLQQLQNLHPTAPASFVAPPVPASAKKYILLDERRMTKMLQKLRNGAAPGRSCWKGEFLYAVC